MLPARSAPVHVAGLVAAACGCFLRYLVGQDTSVLPLDALVVGAVALVVALVRRRWGPVVGMVVAAHPLTTHDVLGPVLQPAGPTELVAALLVAVGVGVALAAGVVAVARPAPRPGGRWALPAAVGVLGLLVVAVAGYVVRNTTYASWDAARVERAGFVERRVEVGGTAMNYAEGPDNGPPLLLVHGQLTDWRSWSRVLPGLAQRFHVFAVDCPGHGASDRLPGGYTAEALVAGTAGFVRQVIGEPVVVVGHSSGGLVAAGLAADAPDLVRAAVLEDPPLFSSVLPRARHTFNHVDLASTAHGFLRSGRTDFTSYYIAHTAVWDLFGPGGANLRERALERRAARPDEPLSLWMLPPTVNEPYRAMPEYDPRFGEAFFDGSFHRGFDHAVVLRRITAPVVLVHASWSYDANGVLLAAMDADDARRARSLLRDVEFHEVDTGHGFHVEDPERFLDLVLPLGR
ncbi:alpha/beta fold hydrolase [Pseudonocardia humida]|uniref:Alpha/beta hydrolase n=1 Tax=Pseudonocardia humida TaxID=2800819 RepID=A0ABT1A2K0_9PSEU|nr:alpha/beta hydrolase [Pseudonocardia humida]MCO1657236.1 alpha/beta hydrolase [Pseudonocardia humida]